MTSMLLFFFFFFWGGGVKVEELIQKTASCAPDLALHSRLVLTAEEEYEEEQEEEDNNLHVSDSSLGYVIRLS